MQLQTLEVLSRRAASAGRRARSVLAQHETSTDRVMTLDATLTLVGSLPDDVRAYFLESVKCLENNLCRPAVVAIWSGFMFLFTQALDEAIDKQNGLDDSRRDRRGKGWRPDSETLRVAVQRRFIGPQEQKELEWYLTVRNRCAHFDGGPSVTLNQALGIAEALLKRIVSLSDTNTGKAIERRSEAADD